MLDAVNNASNLQARQNLQEINPAQAKEEFLALFYKELLKQSFKGPTLNLTDEDKPSLSKMFSSEIMVEKIANELAKRDANKIL